MSYNFILTHFSCLSLSWWTSCPDTVTVVRLSGNSSRLNVTTRARLSGTAFDRDIANPLGPGPLGAHGFSAVTWVRNEE